MTISEELKQIHTAAAISVLPVMARQYGGLGEFGISVKALQFADKFIETLNNIPEAKRKANEYFKASSIIFYDATRNGGDGKSTLPFQDVLEKV